MKRKLIFFAFIIFALVLMLVACDGSGGVKVEITTSKSGEVDVTVYPSDGGSKEQAELTPIVDVQDKDITDDGKGLYRIIFDTSGEGTVSVASTTVQSGDSVTVQAGTSVTVNVTPATDWKLNVCMLDWEFVESSTFVMPEHDVTFLVSFVSKRHSISLSGSGYIITEGSDAVEGTTVYFTINEADLSTDGWYYEDEDVFVESSVEDEMGNRERVNVQKVGENRFRFVMPTFDCNIVMNRHNYGQITESLVYIPGNDSPVDNPADYLTYSFTVDGEPYTVGEPAKLKQTIITITSLNPLYEIESIEYKYGATSYAVTKVNATQYSFNMGYGYLIIYLKDAEMPSGSHTITVNNSEHGRISAPAYAEQNDQVTVTVTPDEEYHLVTLQYSCENDVWNDITLQDGAYVFTMPDADVTLRATFDNTPETTGVLRVYVQGVYGDDYEYSLPEVFSEFRLVYSEENLIIDKLYDGMTLPVEIGNISLWYFINDDYRCLGVYFHNNDVTVANYGFYGQATLEIQEGDLNGEIVVVVAFR